MRILLEASATPMTPRAARSALMVTVAMATAQGDTPDSWIRRSGTGTVPRTDRLMGRPRRRAVQETGGR